MSEEKISSVTEVPFGRLLEEFASRTFDNNKKIAAVLGKDPSETSKFISKQLPKARAENVCTKIYDIFRIVVIELPEEYL